MKNTPGNIPYQPINCDLYDELELRALKAKVCLIVYKNEAGETAEVNGVIGNLRSLTNCVEFKKDKT